MEPSTSTSEGSELFADLCPPRQEATDLTTLPSAGLTPAGFGWVVASSAESRCTAWTYLFTAAIHPANLLVLLGAILLCASHLSAPMVLVGLGMEAAFLGVMQRCAFLRRDVHKCIELQDRAAAQKAREGLILQMGEVHRKELAQIEVLLDKTRANAQRRHGAVLLGAGDSLGMARLTLSYIRLAVDHRASAESLAMTNLETLQATIRSLEAAETARSAGTRPILRRWLAIAHRRAECWSETRDNLEVTGHQLATITELVYLLHQESLAPVSSARLSPELDCVLADFEHGESARRELADLGIDGADTLDVQEITAGLASA